MEILTTLSALLSSIGVLFSLYSLNKYSKAERELYSFLNEHLEDILNQLKKVTDDNISFEDLKYCDRRSKMKRKFKISDIFNTSEEKIVLNSKQCLDLYYKIEDIVNNKHVKNRMEFYDIKRFLCNMKQDAIKGRVDLFNKVLHKSGVIKQIELGEKLI